MPQHLTIGPQLFGDLRGVGPMLLEDSRGRKFTKLVPHHVFRHKDGIKNLAVVDQNHRPQIHRTYGDAMRMHLGQQTSFSLTKFGNWPVILPTFDGYHQDNGFYQVVTLLGLNVVINII